MTVMASFVFAYGGMRTGNSSLIATVNNSNSTSTEGIEKTITLISDSQLVVKNLTFPPSGFIVIYDEASSKPGKIIGSSEFINEIGTNDPLVSLERSVVDGEILYVGYYEDDGDTKFDVSLDMQKENVLDGSSYIKFVVVKKENAQDLEPRL